MIVVSLLVFDHLNLPFHEYLRDTNGSVTVESNNERGAYNFRAAHSKEGRELPFLSVE